MKRQLIVALILLVVSASVHADSIRCRGALVKVGDSSNQLLKKCGDPASKFSSKVTIRENGRERQASVSNWVYRRSGKKDRVVSVQAGAVLKISSD